MIYLTISQANISYGNFVAPYLLSIFNHLPTIHLQYTIILNVLWSMLLQMWHQMLQSTLLQNSYFTLWAENLYLTPAYLFEKASHHSIKSEPQQNFQFTSHPIFFANLCRYIRTWHYRSHPTNSRCERYLDKKMLWHGHHLRYLDNLN